MADTRKKNTKWKLNFNSEGIPSTSNAQLAVLMDIRDELQRLNSLLHCSRFLSIPDRLEKISRNTAKK